MFQPTYMHIWNLYHCSKRDTLRNNLLGKVIFRCGNRRELVSRPFFRRLLPHERPVVRNKLIALLQPSTLWIWSIDQATYDTSTFMLYWQVVVDITSVFRTGREDLTVVVLEIAFNIPPPSYVSCAMPTVIFYKFSSRKSWIYKLLELYIAFLPWRINGLFF